MGIPAGLATATYTSINVFPCVDVVNGETYRISFWKKATSGTNPQTAITTGTAQTTAGTATIIKTYTASPIVVGAAWVKDSVDYTATASGTRYFSIRAKGGANTTTALTIFMDDIMIEKVVSGTVGVKTISANDASATNEIQSLTLNGTNLSLSNGGGSVTLPTGTTYTEGSGIDIVEDLR